MNIEENFDEESKAEAYHESGHFVIAYKLKWDISNINVTPSKDKNRHELYISLNKDKSDEEKNMFIVSGEIAYNHFYLFKDGPRLNKNGLIKKVYLSFKDQQSLNNTDLNMKSIESCYDIIFKYKDIIGFVAQKIIEKKCLLGKDAIKLINDFYKERDK